MHTRISLHEKVLVENDKLVQVITLENANGMSVELCDLGAALWRVQVPDSKNNKTDLVLGYEKAELWHNNPYFMGVTVGPVANRISEAEFIVDEQLYRLSANEGKHCLHSGEAGLQNVRWLFETGQSQKNAWAKFVYIRRDGEGGFPGNLHVEVEYRLTDDNILFTKYRATCDQNTPISITNHAYWNLADDKQDGILNHQLVINSQYYLPVSEQGIPTGEVKPTKGGPFDFSGGKSVGKDIAQVVSGYDHYMVLERHKSQQMFHALTLTEPKSGRRLELHTTELGLQFYSGCHMDGSVNERSGLPLSKYMGLCLETHGFPNAVNTAHFPTVIISPEQEYQQTNIYKFEF